MSRPPRWHQMVMTSREEALNAVEFYNRPAGRRSLEAFLVHMHIAWLYVVQAEFLRDGVDYFYRQDKNPKRYVKIDGERKTWELDRCVKQRWPDASDPVRNNLELTVRLRNRIEHRHSTGLAVAATGFCQKSAPQLRARAGHAVRPRILHCRPGTYADRAEYFHARGRCQPDSCPGSTPETTTGFLHQLPIRFGARRREAIGASSSGWT